MIVIGLDTDSHGFHWVSSIPLDTGENGLPSRVGFTITKGELEDRRATVYLMARRFFSQIADVEDEVHIFCEEPLALRNGKTTRVLGLAAGVIWAAFVEAGHGLRTDRWWYWVDVAHWKKEVVGKGNAAKNDIRAFCEGNPAWQNLAAERGAEGIDYRTYFEADPDLFDAWCLMTYGVRQLHGR